MKGRQYRNIPGIMNDSRSVVNESSWKKCRLLNHQSNHEQAAYKRNTGKLFQAEDSVGVFSRPFHLLREFGMGNWMCTAR